MKITFDDGGYLELQRAKKAHHVYVMVAARDANNPLKLLVNSAEIQLSELIELVKSVSGPIMLEGKIDDINDTNSTDNSNQSENNQSSEQASEHSEPQVDE